ncbi:hypothetical protein QBC39DRAFT_134095 [Podospora conica]|nr:hypothetical protein QBC39DRAFT_134095 [Schizothecium conicum]
MCETSPTSSRPKSSHLIPHPTTSPPTPQKMSSPQLHQWILDTRPWWPEATQTKHLETHASRALSLLPPATRTAILRYYHILDAKMALASALLKHYLAARTDPSLPWHSTPSHLTRDPRTGKPLFTHPTHPLAFNITHQAGVVALLAVAHPPSLTVQVGIDLVSPTERRARDRALVASSSWPTFVDMHADVFSPREAAYLKHAVLAAVPGMVAPAAGGPDAVVDAKLRAFYALWALREAYVKLTGEALMAEWLGELEFRGFRPAAPTAGFAVPAREEGAWDGRVEGAGRERYGAQVVRHPEVWFRGGRVEGVNMELRAMGEDFMICTAVRTPGREEVGMGWRLGPYRVLDLDEVLEFAEGRAEGGTWEGE